MDNRFIQKRDRFLSSLLAGNFHLSEETFKGLANEIINANNLSEEDQKAINQATQVFKVFKTEIMANCSNEIVVSREIIRKTMGGIVREETSNPSLVEFGEWKKRLGFSGPELEIMFKTVSSLQLTSGCSNFCRRCNEWALPGPRKHFNFDAAQKIIKAIFDSGNKKFSLYCASDPLDWNDNGRDITDILDFMEKHGFKSEFGILTKMPRGTEAILEKLVRQNRDLGVSITKKNRNRIKAIENKTGALIQKFHDMDDLLIPAGLDEDFVSIKASITDNYGTEITPYGAFIVIPSFTSALNPTGQARIPISKNTEYLLVKKTGRSAMGVEYFKPLKCVDFKGREFTHEKLLDTQVETILLDKGPDGPPPPGMTSMAEHLGSYEPRAVNVRKKLLDCVIRDIKNKNLSNQEKQITIKAFKDSCRVDLMMEARKRAFSFFLESITDYLLKKPFQRQIIIKLREGGVPKYHGIDKHFAGQKYFSIDSILGDKRRNGFDIFQALTSMLLENPCNESIGEFIKNNRTIYEPGSDRFIPKPSKIQAGCVP